MCRLTYEIALPQKSDRLTVLKGADRVSPILQDNRRDDSRGRCNSSTGFEMGELFEL